MHTILRYHILNLFLIFINSLFGQYSGLTSVSAVRVLGGLRNHMRCGVLNPVQWYAKCKLYQLYYWSGSVFFLKGNHHIILISFFSLSSSFISSFFFLPATPLPSFYSLLLEFMLLHLEGHKNQVCLM